MSNFDNYQSRYEWAKLERGSDGVLEIALHTDGGPFVWGPVARSEMAELFSHVAADRSNRVVIFTGTGSAFTPGMAPMSTTSVPGPEKWDEHFYEARKLPESFLDIAVPVIAAVNGPARVHSELALLSDIVIASDNTIFQDFHLLRGIIPGDGVGLIWKRVLGEVRGRYFIWTGQELTAQQALDFGAVSEILALEDLLPRARKLAADLAKKPDLALRYTRLIFTREWRKLMQSELDLNLMLEGSGIMALARKGVD